MDADVLRVTSVKLSLVTKGAAQLLVVMRMALRGLP